MIQFIDPKDEEKEMIKSLNLQLEQTKAQSLEAKRESKKALCYAITALILTAVFGLQGWIVMCRDWSNQTIQQSTKPITEQVNKQTLQLQKTNQLLDSLVHLQGKFSKQLLDNKYS